MGTNPTGCTEWERDFDPVTEKPFREKIGMSDKVNISYCSNSIANALHAALRAKRISKIGIDDIRAAVVGYLSAGPVRLDDFDFQQLEERTLRRTVEKVG
jgi:hypothetical protein